MRHSTRLRKLQQALIDVRVFAQGIHKNKALPLALHPNIGGAPVEVRAAVCTANALVNGGASIAAIDIQRCVDFIAQRLKNRDSEYF